VEPDQSAPKVRLEVGNVRPATDSDASGLIALIGSCFDEYEGCVLDTQVEMAHLHRISTHYTELNGFVWVAESNERIVGSVACRPRSESASLELQMLYVDATQRRRGLGTAFIVLVEARARDRGIEEVELWSDTRFLEAHRLYRSLGYERLEETRELHDLSDTVEYHFRKRIFP